MVTIFSIKQIKDNQIKPQWQGCNTNPANKPNKPQWRFIEMDCTKIMVNRSDQLTVIQSDQRTASLINNFYRIEILESISVHVYQNPIMFQWKATPPDLANKTAPIWRTRTMYRIDSFNEKQSQCRKLVVK